MPAKIDPVKLWIMENTAPATAACGVKCFNAKLAAKAEFCIATSICMARRSGTLEPNRRQMNYVTT